MAVSANPTPIWNGVRKTLSSTAGSFLYSVRTETPNELIFSGRATNRPGETTVAVELFDILAPHLRQTVPDVYDVYDNDSAVLVGSDFSRRFIFQKQGGAAENVDVVADYSHIYGNASPTSRVLDSEPVLLELPYSAPLVGSVRYCPSGSVALRRGATAVSTLSNGSVRPVNVCFDIHDYVAVGDTIRIAWPSGTNGLSGTQLGPAFKVQPSCGETWVLYYVNRFGGLDQIWMRGQCRRTDSFEREEVAVASTLGAYNTDPDARLSRIDTAITWELNTGYLSDEQARIFSDNVPGTPCAYLLRLGGPSYGGGGWPVKVVDASFQHGQTIAKNGRTPVNYTLTVQLQQERPRL